MVHTMFRPGIYTYIYCFYIVYILAKIMFRPCIYHVHSLNVQVHVFIHIKYKSKKSLRSGFEPRI